MHSSKPWLSGCSRNSLGTSTALKKQPGSNKGCIMWNKEKSTGNQWWGEGNQDSNQQKDERNIQPEQNKETRIQKNEESLRNPQEFLKIFFIVIWVQLSTSFCHHFPLPHPSPPPTFNSTPLWFCPWVLYTCSWKTLPFSPPLSLPTSPLVTVTIWSHL